jgi:hypothetical protein
VFSMNASKPGFDMGVSVRLLMRILKRCHGTLSMKVIRALTGKLGVGRAEGSDIRSSFECGWSHWLALEKRGEREVGDDVGDDVIGSPGNRGPDEAETIDG